MPLINALLNNFSHETHNHFKRLLDLLAPYTKRAFFVGGCVRDTLLNLPCGDFDIEVYDIDPETFDQLMQTLGAKGVGKSYFVYKYGVFDLALPRTETKIGRGHKAFSVEVCSDPKQASMRRDFTLNALMLNLFDSTLLDFWGGEQDLRSGVLRHINDQKFCEDSLRVLRGVQFAARFGFKMAPKTVRLCQKIPLDDLNKERIYGEIAKLLDGKKLHYGWDVFVRTGAFSALFSKTVSSKEYCRIARALASFDRPMSRLYFLYLLKAYLNLSSDQIAHQLGIPKKMHRALSMQPNPTRRYRDRFLITLARNYPIKEWLGGDARSIKRARELNIYEMPSIPKANVSDVMKEGFTGADITKELRRRIAKELRGFS